MAKANLTAERVREALDYNPETGEFFWKIDKRVLKAGSRAGGLNAAGYVQIVLDGGNHYGHRLAWLHAYGSHPKGQIDHINGLRADNRLANLRDVTDAVNSQNRRGPQSNKRQSTLLGASRSASKSKPWAATLGINRRVMYLGLYATEQEAHEAYLAAKRKLHEGCTI